MNFNSPITRSSQTMKLNKEMYVPCSNLIIKAILLHYKDKHKGPRIVLIHFVCACVCSYIQRILTEYTNYRVVLGGSNLLQRSVDARTKLAKLKPHLHHLLEQVVSSLCGLVVQMGICTVGMKIPPTL